MKNKPKVGIAILMLLFSPLLSDAANYRSFFSNSLENNEINVIFLGNAGVLLNSSQGTVVIDPSTLLEDYDIGQLRQANSVIVLYTHGHGDHFNSRRAVKIFRVTKAKFLCDTLVYQVLEGKIPQENLINGMAGKSYGFGDIRVDVIKGNHSSPINLYRISLNHIRVFHGGDSGYVPLGNYPSDIAFVPSGMPSPSASPEDAFRMVFDLKPQVVLPIHGSEHQHHALEKSIHSKMPGTRVIIPLKQVSKSITIE